MRLILIFIIKENNMAELMIMFRETLEMALIVGIISTYLIKTDNKSLFPAVSIGCISAIISSIILAFVFEQFVDGGFAESEELFEGIIMITASILLGSMVIWMAKNKGHAEQLQKITKRAINSKNAFWGIFAIVFLSVLREGIEIVLFLNALISMKGGISIFSSILGVLVALCLSYAIYYKGQKISLGKFFNYSSLVLILIAAGLLAHGVHELEEAGVIPYNKETSIIWDINPSLTLEQKAYNETVEKHQRKYPVLHEKGFIGSLLKAMFGYNGNPSKIEITSWAIAMIILFYFYNYNSRPRNR